jgi:hypothetical protein
MESKPKRGRPRKPKAERVTEVVALRMTQGELADCERAASQADTKLSDWMRDRLSKAAKRESKRD